MFPIIAIYLLLLVSLVFPPLLLISVPLAIWYGRRVARRASYLRRSRDRFLEENQVLTAAKWLRS